MRSGNDSDEFASAFRELYLASYRAAFRICGSHGTAEDACQ